MTAPALTAGGENHLTAGPPRMAMRVRIHANMTLNVGNQRRAHKGKR